MRIERLFNVLVLGGAALGAACGHDDSNESDTTEPSTKAGSGSGGSALPNTGGFAGSSTPSEGGSDAGGMNGAGSSSGGATPSGGGTGGDAGESASGGSEVGGTSSGGAGGSGGDAGSAGSGMMAGAGSGGDGGGGGAGTAGSGGVLECRLDPSGRGDPRDPCGCPCCWAVGCPNTDEGCCAGFCDAGDEGRGCCDQ